MALGYDPAGHDTIAALINSAAAMRNTQNSVVAQQHASRNIDLLARLAFTKRHIR